MKKSLNLQYAKAEYTIKKERFSINYNRFLKLLQAVSSDKIFLKYIYNSTEKELFENAENVFFTIANGHPSIMQLRYIDANGNECIRIERTSYGSDIEKISQDKLQNKKHRDYFKEAIAKDKNEYYISRLDLNMEYNEIEVPYKPVLRLALGVYVDEKKVGIVIVNLFMQEILQSSVDSSAFDIYIYDDQKSLLYSNVPDTPKWSRYLNYKDNYQLPEFNFVSSLFKTDKEEFFIGLLPKTKSESDYSSFNNIFFILLFAIIPSGFILAYLLAKIPERLHKELHLKDQMMIQQSKFVAMGEMIGAIAHQWRQPLNAIGVLAQEIALRYDYGKLDKEQVKSITAELMEYVDYMSKTIDDFRNFFKPDKITRVFDAHEAIEHALHILRKQFSAHGIMIEFDDAKEPFNIKGVPSEFEQVILNILNNAKDALDSLEKNSVIEKKIVIRILQTDGFVKILISDTGEGIPENILETIFEPYVSSKNEQQGSGLGLYLAKIIIEQNMSGKINARNIETGAEFEILLNSHSS